MAHSLPTELARLLTARGRARDDAWSAFVATYHRLLLHVARAVGRDYDGAMDAYAYVLEHLSADDCRRLRGYVVDPRSTFTTWLVVVARRLCVDFMRQRYGRADRDLPEDERPGRRRLFDLAGEDLDVTLIPDPSGRTPDTDFDDAVLHAALAGAMSTLAPRDRLLLALRFEDGLTADAIAKTLGFPSPFHVYRRLNRLLADLRGQLTATHEGDPAA